MTLGAEHATARKGGVTPEILHMAAGLRRKGYGWQALSVQTGVHQETLRLMLSGVRTPEREPVKIERWVTRGRHLYGPPTPSRSDLIRFRIEAVAKRHGLPLACILGARRTRPVSIARHEAYWEIKTTFGLSYPRLGVIFGRDHTSIMHGVRKHEERMGMAA